MFRETISGDGDGATPKFRVVICYRGHANGRAGEVDAGEHFRKIIQAIVAFTADDPAPPPPASAYAQLISLIAGKEIRIILPIINGREQDDVTAVSSWGQLSMRGRLIFHHALQLFGPYGILLQHDSEDTVEGSIEGKSTWTCATPRVPAVGHDMMEAGVFLTDLFEGAGLSPETTLEILAGTYGSDEGKDGKTE